MHYAIVANPRDRISPGLTAAGSVAIVSFHLGQCLARRNHQVTLVAARGADQSERQELEPGLSVCRVRNRLAKLHKYRELIASIFESVPPHFLSRAYFFDYYLGAALALRSSNPEVIHIQNYGQAAPIFRYVFPHARIVIHLHDTAMAQVSTRIAKRVLGQADLIVTCSDYVTESVRTAHPSLKTPVRTINNGVSEQDFAPRSRRTDSTGRPFQLAYIGRLSPEKGVHVLVEAFNEIVQNTANVQLNLVGGAALFSYAVVKIFARRDPHWAAVQRFYGRNAIRRLLAVRGEPGPRYVNALRKLQSPAAAAATRYCGEQSRESVANLIRAADIAVVPSVCDEPFGIPAVEAMAAEVPVIAAAAGGLRNILRDGDTGILVPRSDPKALAAAIIDLLGDPERRSSLGRAGRASAAARFTWDCVAQNLLRALDESGIECGAAHAAPTVTGESH
jgi:glycosyltransferase involved in cell wall biosynthesis